MVSRHRSPRRRDTEPRAVSWRATAAGTRALAAEEEADRTIPWRLLEIGWALGASARPAQPEDANARAAIDRLVTAAASELDRVGQHDAAEAIRRASARHRDRDSRPDAPIS